MRSIGQYSRGRHVFRCPRCRLIVEAEPGEVVKVPAHWDAGGGRNSFCRGDDEGEVGRWVPAKECIDCPTCGNTLGSRDLLIEPGGSP